MLPELSKTETFFNQELRRAVRTRISLTRRRTCQVSEIKKPSEEGFECRDYREDQVCGDWDTGVTTIDVVGWY